MVKLGNAIERALVKLVDDLAEFIETLPQDDPKQRRLDEQLRRLEDAIGALH
jgi:rhamnogalacturonyl hydrolase YesR